MTNRSGHPVALVLLLGATLFGREPARGDTPSACTTDADCGAASSGRACVDLQCVDGCRGAAGNACPSGQICTSVDATVGTCSAASSTPEKALPGTAEPAGRGCTVTNADDLGLGVPFALTVMGFSTAWRRRRNLGRR